PSDAEAGEAILVDWTVVNQGVGAATASEWVDRIILSTDAMLGNDDDIVLTQTLHRGELPVGDSYSVDGQLVEIPLAIETGNYNLFVFTDAADQVYEGDVGSASTNNRITSIPIAVSRSTADLSVVSVTAQTDAVAGSSIDIQWTVHNQGPVATVATWWFDSVYLSVDETIDADDVLLGRRQRTNPLAAGVSYDRTDSFRVPDEISGDYHILVVADSMDQVLEGASGAESNNLSASQGTANITLPAVADLAILHVDTPVTGISGQAIQVGWTVVNQGDADINQTSWTDRIYLSKDQVFDRRTDTLLGSSHVQVDLPTGGQYSRTQAIEIPSGLSGPYYVFVLADANGTLFERGALADNVRYDETPVEIHLQAQADLVAAALTIPEDAVPGMEVAVTYTVDNLGSAISSGRWRDSLFVSNDATWSIDDQWIGDVEMLDASIGAGASYTRTLNAPLPGVIPGEYFVIVRSDIRNAVAESNESNNVAASIESATVQFPELQLDQPASMDLGAGQFRYFRLDLPAGQTVQIQLTSGGAVESYENRMYVAAERAPTLSDHDYAAIVPFSAEQSIVIPSSRPVSYYIMVEADQAATSPQSISVSAKLLQFSVSDTNYGVGGNAGNLTLQINGAKFDPSVRAILTDSTGATHNAVQMWPVNEVRAYATFDLRGLTPGRYDVLLEKSDGRQLRVERGLEVVPGEAGGVRPRIDAANVARNGTPFSFIVHWENTGVNDSFAPLLQIDSDNPFGVFPGDESLGTNHVFLGVSDTDGPVGIIRPGQRVSRVFFSQSSDDTQTITVDRVLKNPSGAIDWEYLMPWINTIQQSSAPGFDLFVHLRSSLDGTAGDLGSLLAHNANRIGNVNGDNDPSDLNDLLATERNYGFLQSQRHVSGRITRQLFDTIVSHLQVDLIDSSGQLIYSTTSADDGSFIAGPLHTGQYEVVVRSPNLAKLASASFQVDEGDESINLEVALSTNGFIDGTISNELTGMAVQSAEVALYLDGVLFDRQYSDRRGEYRFSSLPHGQYAVNIVAEGFARTSAHGIIVSQAPLERIHTQLSAESALELSLRDEAGELLTEYSAVLVPRQEQFERRYGVDVSGNLLSQRSLSPGIYDLVIQKDGFVPIQLDGLILSANETMRLDAVTAQRGVMLSGSVIDRRVGAEGLTHVTVRDTATNQVITHLRIQNGQFATTEPLLPGRYWIGFIQPGIISNEVIVEAVSGDEIRNLQLQTFPGATIAGQLTNDQSQPLGHIPVVLTNDAGDLRLSQTDSEGRFQFEHLSAASYRVAIRNSPIYQDVTVTDVESGVYAVEMSAGIVGTVQGVVENANGQPLAGASARLINAGQVIANSETDQDGRYLFYLTTTDETYQVLPAHAEMTFSPITVDSNLSTNAIVDFRPGDQSLTLRFSGNGHVNGFSGTIRLAGPNEQVVVRDVAGEDEVRFTNLVPGQYSIRATTESGLTGNRTVSVGAANSDFQISLVQTHAVRGVVSDQTGAPADAVVVQWESRTTGESFSAITDADGQYQLERIPIDEYDIAVVGIGVPYQSIGSIPVVGQAEVPLSVVAGDEQFSGRVVDDDGNPMADVTLVALDGSGGAVGLGTSDENGFFVIAASRSDVTSVSIYSPGFAPQTKPISSAERLSGQIGEVSLVHAAIGTEYQTASPSQPVGLPASGNGEGEWAQSMLFDLIDTISDFKTKSKYHVSNSERLAPPLDCHGLCVQEWKWAGTAIKKQDDAWEKARDTARALDGARLQYWATVTRLITEVMQDMASIAAPIQTLGEGMGWLRSLPQKSAWWDVGLSFLGEVDKFVTGTPAIWNAETIEEGVYATQDDFNNYVDLIGLADAFKGVLVENYEFLERFKVLSNGFAYYSQMLGALKAIINIFTGYKEKFEEVGRLISELVDLKQQAEKTHSEYVEWATIARFLTDDSNACVRFVARNIQELCKRKERPDDPDDEGKIRLVVSKDPNDILGPDGVGPQRWVSVVDTLDYKIRFENDPEFATAPAQVVSITQQLDSDLDVRTFRLGDFGIGEWVIDVPENRAFFTERLDLRTTQGVFVDVIAGLDVARGQAFWEFRSIDPMTGGL
ncbi:MAG: carboxypeptidase regulatory-like domain-containing protein, partial [Planctomycetales bacterium]|nr:carboxypeptidase regulatory-like domain-containing protein [Planctomycetales bacterium]